MSPNYFGGGGEGDEEHERIKRSLWKRFSWLLLLLVGDQ